MKTIIIPTDFSRAAENAALYGLQLAAGFKANIILINALQVPLPVVTPAGIDLPFLISDDAQEEALHQLEVLKDKLKYQVIHRPGLSENAPEIKLAAGYGPAYAFITSRFNKERADLVVMGLSGAGGLRRFFTGSTSRDLINTAEFPVLLIPKDFHYRKIRHIVFTTDLNVKDIAMVKYLADIAKQLGAELKLAHVVTENSTGALDKIEHFLAAVRSTVSDVAVSYQNIYNRKEENGIDWITQHLEMDWLVMVHRSHGFFFSLFNEPFSQRMAKESPVPILVIPEDFIS